MKRLALALSTAVLGTGCYVAPDCTARNVSVAWSGFDGPGTGQVNQTCGTAGVPYVDLWLDGAQVQGPVGASHFDCTTYGVTVAGISNGNHTMTVEGVAADGTINYRDEISFAASGCNDFALPAATPAAGSVDLVYAFQSGASCASATSYMWFTIDDLVTGLVDPASVDASHTPRLWPCGPTDPVFSLPAGNFQLRTMNEMVENPANVFTQAAYLCKAPLAFSVVGRTQTVLNPSLADTGGAACLP